MNNKLSNRTLTAFLSTVVLLGIYSPKVESEEIQTTNNLPERSGQVIETKNSVTTIEHQYQGKPAVTIRVKNIPVITLTGQDRQEKAAEVVAKLTQLAPEDTQQMRLSWNKQSRSYFVIVANEVIVELNKNSFSSQKTKSPKAEGEQVVNRLRWLVSNSPSNNSKVEIETGKTNHIKINTDSIGIISPKVETISVKSTRKGVASWYGPGFHGRKTANGERYNSNEYTAAHKTLPFGTRVRVTNLNNGRSVVVRINDRGPFIRGREIDLSAQAARSLNISGLGKVKIEVMNF